MKVFVLIKLLNGFNEDAAALEIEDLANVTRVIVVESAYDLIVEIEAERDDGVKATIKKIRRLDSTKGISTLVKHKGVP